MKTAMESLLILLFRNFDILTPKKLDFFFVDLKFTLAIAIICSMNLFVYEYIQDKRMTNKDASFYMNILRVFNIVFFSVCCFEYLFFDSISLLLSGAVAMFFYISSLYASFRGDLVSVKIEEKIEETNK